MTEHIQVRNQFFQKAATPDGAICPTCDRFGKEYRRRINATMARALIALYRETIAKPTQRWFHYSEFAKTRTDYEKLQFWRMIEHKPNPDDPLKKDSGYWRITPAGRAFVRMKRTMPTYARVYNGEVLGYSEEPTTIRRALGHKFNYQELMGDALNFDEPEPQRPLFGDLL